MAKKNFAQGLITIFTFAFFCIKFEYYCIMKLQFSGHDSFICKHFWLKKGYDFIQEGNKTFNDEIAVVDLGVGKNMVTAISYWLKAYGITDSTNQITELGHYLFNEKNGHDPFLEDLGSIWLLHYSLIKADKASIYNLFFNEFRKDKFSFTREQLLSFIVKKLKSIDQKNVNANTLNSDINVFIRNYLMSIYRNKKFDIEDEFSNLFIDLQFMQAYQSENAANKIVEWYQLNNDVRNDLPAEIVLFSILDNESYGDSISFVELQSGYNSPGSIFALNEDGLYNKIEDILQICTDATYTQSAGARELQFKSKPDKWEILNDYYRN